MKPINRLGYLADSPPPLIAAPALSISPAPTTLAPLAPSSSAIFTQAITGKLPVSTAPDLLRHPNLLPPEQSKFKGMLAGVLVGGLTVLLVGGVIVWMRR